MAVSLVNSIKLGGGDIKDVELTLLHPFFIFLHTLSLLIVLLSRFFSVCLFIPFPSKVGILRSAGGGHDAGD